MITAAHNIKFSGGSFIPSQILVGSGTSYIGNIGKTAGVLTIYVSPTYVPGDQNTLDYAFLRLNRRISSPSSAFIIAQTPNLGDSILFCGYGIPSLMSGEAVSNTGTKAGFYASYSPSGPLSWNTSYDTGFYTFLSNSGYATTRDSGGGVKAYNPLNEKWEHLGLIKGGATHSTNILNYNNVDIAFYEYLIDIVSPSDKAAQSPNLDCTVIGASVQLSFSRLEINREYWIMRSDALIAWEEAHRFTADGVTGTWSEALALEGRRFYKLGWND